MPDMLFNIMVILIHYLCNNSNPKHCPYSLTNVKPSA